MAIRDKEWHEPIPLRNVEPLFTRVRVEGRQRKGWSVRKYYVVEPACR